jgi:hypothetical protein
MRDEFRSYCEEGAHPEIVINKRSVLKTSEYVDVLKRIRKTVESDPLVAIDDDTPGAKSTSCNWGLCSDDKNHYPYPEMHTFPQDFADYGRMSQLRAAKPCPMMDSSKPSRGGCFWQCRVFSGKRKRISKDQALRLIDAKIIECEG